MAIRVQQEDFDIGAEITALTADRADVGAVATFTGLVRDQGGQVAEMALEHYPGMTEQALAGIEAEAHQRWPLLATTIIHRYGPLKPQDRIVLVIAASAHRQAAFDAAQFMMDYLKTKAPFWKREAGADGSAEWVDARDSDDAATMRWS